MTAPVRTCYGCRHCSYNQPLLAPAAGQVSCLRDAVEVTHLVTGEVTRGNVYLCDAERYGRDGGKMCGTVGRFWSAKA